MQLKAQEMADHLGIARATLRKWNELGLLRPKQGTRHGVTTIYDLGDLVAASIAKTYATKFGFGPDVRARVAKLIQHGTPEELEGYALMESPADWAFVEGKAKIEEMLGKGWVVHLTLREHVEGLLRTLIEQGVLEKPAHWLD